MIFCFDEFELDVEHLQLRRGRKVVKADPMVLRVLSVLLREAGRLVSKEELATAVWPGRTVRTKLITVNMARLRKTLGDKRGGRRFIVNAYGQGYRFVRTVTWRASPAREVAPRAVRRVMPQPPFVGRGFVLARLHLAVSRAQQGHGRLCLLLGEPGIGKTSVADQLTEELLRKRTRCAWGFCREGIDTAPLLPWLRILRQVYESEPSETWSERLGPDAGELHRLLQEGRIPVAPGTPPASNSAAWTRSFDVIARALAGASREEPWVLVIDDLHRADAASLELLSYLLDRIDPMRLLIVATMRSSKPDGPWVAHGALQHVLEHASSEAIPLDLLRERDVRSYVAALFDEATGQYWGRAIFLQSQGNPFIMSELVKQLATEMVAAPDALSLPDSARAVVRQRLSRLDRSTYALLEIAAVLGRSFEVWLLHSVSERDLADIQACVEQARAAELLVSARDTDGGFAFCHDLLRLVLYEDLAPADQRRYHLRAARALEQRAESTPDQVPVSALAYHFYAAMPETDLEKTVHYCRAAAMAATTVFANADVARYLRQALEALALSGAPDPALRAALMLRLAFHTRSHSRVFIPTVRELITLARSLGDGVTMSLAAVTFVCHPELMHLPHGHEVLTEALALLPPERRDIRAIALCSLACVSPHGYSAEHSEALLVQGEALALESGIGAVEQCALLSRLYLHGGPHDGADDETPRRIEALARKDPSSVPMVPVYLARYRVVRALQRGEVASIGPLLDGYAGHARHLSHSEMLWHCDRYRALLRLQTSPSGEAVTMLETLHRQAAQKALLGTAPFRAFDHVVVLRELADDFAPLDAEAREALSYSPYDPPSIWSLKVRALEAAGLHAQARATLETVTPEQLAQLPRDSQYLGTLGHLARAVYGVGARAYAATLIELLAPHREQLAAHVSFWCDGSIAQLLGMLASLLGRQREALSWLAEAIAHAERAELPLAAADARLMLAEHLVHDRRKRARARSLAREAYATADRLGFTRRARAALRFLSDVDEPDALLDPPLNSSATPRDGRGEGLI